MDANVMMHNPFSKKASYARNKSTIYSIRTLTCAAKMTKEEWKMHPA
jgi:hypothetical protein